jgi:hypothetical protein
MNLVVQGFSCANKRDGSDLFWQGFGQTTGARSLSRTTGCGFSEMDIGTRNAHISFAVATGNQ